MARLVFVAESETPTLGDIDVADVKQGNLIDFKGNRRGAFQVENIQRDPNGTVHLLCTHPILVGVRHLTFAPGARVNRVRS